jgi:hypothetical protein
LLNTIFVWLSVAALFGAGVFNLLGTPATREGFVRWGYPHWWGYVAGALEIASALMIALAFTRVWGLALGGLIIAVAIATIVRRREFGHLVPLGVFSVLLVVTGVTASIKPQAASAATSVSTSLVSSSVTAANA